MEKEKVGEEGEEGEEEGKEEKGLISLTLDH